MATSEAELHRALRDAPAIRTGGQAAGLPTSFSFFFFLVKKKDTFNQEFTVLLPKKINAVAEDIFSKGFDNGFFMCYNKRSIRFHLSDSRNEAE